jgi:signal peptidase I
MGKLMRFLMWTVVVIAVVIGIARLVAIRWWRIPADDPVLATSVMPTLYGGDLVLLWRATAPHFGSLVVCADPEDPSRKVIGRIVGEANDKVSVEGDKLRVNGASADTESACGTFTVNDPSTGAEVKQYCDIEAVGGEAHMRGSGGGSEALSQQQREYQVAEGKVFLLSDNRRYPFDSRHYGALDRGTCKEAVFFRIFSKDGFKDVDNRFTYIR